MTTTPSQALFIPSFIYSYCNASTGFNLDALLAGYNPKKTPTANENTNAPMITGILTE
jgi:hypothetical protein